MTFKKGDKPIAGFQKGHKTFTATKPDLTKKSGKYWLAKQKGLKSCDAMREAGYNEANVNNVTNVERTTNYKLCELTFKSAILAETTIPAITKLINRNMMQDKDIGGSNNAIRIAMEKIEPDNQPTQAQQINIVIEEDGDKERTISTTQGNPA